MKGIKALTNDCIKYLAYRPNGPFYLTISQIEELEESRSTKPFKRKENGEWVFMSPQGREIPVKPVMIK